MREWVQHVSCDVHSGEPANEELQGFWFYWPPNGKWYLIDPCKKDSELLETVLLPFIEVAPPHTEPSTEPEDPLPQAPGVKWYAYDKVSDDRITNHAWGIAKDGVLCGMVTQGQRQVGPAVMSAPTCRRCTNMARELARSK